MRPDLAGPERLGYHRVVTSVEAILARHGEEQISAEEFDRLFGTLPNDEGTPAAGGAETDAAADSDDEPTAVGETEDSAVSEDDEDEEPESTGDSDEGSAA